MTKVRATKMGVRKGRKSQIMVALKTTKRIKNEVRSFIDPPPLFEPASLIPQCHLPGFYFQPENDLPTPPGSTPRMFPSLGTALPETTRTPCRPGLKQIDSPP